MFGEQFHQPKIAWQSPSGLRDTHTLFRTTMSGADTITGGSFGPEGSAVSFGLALIASGVFFILVRRRAEWVSIRFQLRPKPAS
jgi:hypothetical protein